MTEKNVHFLFSYPPPPFLPPQTMGMGSIGQNSTFCSRTASTQTHNKDICTGKTCADPGIFCVCGGGGGPGSSTYYTVYRGSNGYITHFPGGWGDPAFSRGVQLLITIETNITTTCDFPGRGLDPLAPLWIRTWTTWHFGTNTLRRACAASF